MPGGESKAMTVTEMRSPLRGLAVALALVLGLDALASASDLMETGDLGQLPAAQRDAAIRQFGVGNQALIDQRGTCVRRSPRAAPPRKPACCRTAAT